MRSCGECNVCCVYPSVPELKKPAGTPCEFLSECGDCSVYGQHPKSCKEYTCAWIEGHGKDADRPDKSGVLVDFRDSQFGLVLIARSHTPGSNAIRNKQGKTAIKRISKDAKTKCYVTADDNNQRVVKTVG